MLEPVMYEGGVHKHKVIVELVEDLGGYILQINVMQSEVVIMMMVPHEDVELVSAQSKKLLGKLTRAPLTGTEIAVVAPSLAYHHLPHQACDVAEFLRRKGANTNMVGLARGYGKRVCQLNARERAVINEHDIAVIPLGNFEDCIKNYKVQIFKDLDVPFIVTGGPDIDAAELPYAWAYVGGLGRITHRLRKEEDLVKMDQMADAVAEYVDGARRELDMDPLSVTPARVMQLIEDQIPAIEHNISPTAVTVQLRGLRVKLPYDEFHEEVGNVKFEEGVILSDIADIVKSSMRNYIIVRIRPKSETNIVI